MKKRKEQERRGCQGRFGLSLECGQLGEELWILYIEFSNREHACTYLASYKTGREAKLLSPSSAGTDRSAC